MSTKRKRSNEDGRSLSPLELFRQSSEILARTEEILQRAHVKNFNHSVVGCSAALPLLIDDEPFHMGSMLILTSPKKIPTISAKAEYSQSPPYQSGTDTSRALLAPYKTQYKEHIEESKSTVNLEKKPEQSYTEAAIFPTVSAHFGPIPEIELEEWDPFHETEDVIRRSAPTIAKFEDLAQEIMPQLSLTELDIRQRLRSHSDALDYRPYLSRLSGAHPKTHALRVTGTRLIHVDFDEWESLQMGKVLDDPTFLKATNQQKESILTAALPNRTSTSIDTFLTDVHASNCSLPDLLHSDSCKLIYSKSENLTWKHRTPSVLNCISRRSLAGFSDFKSSISTQLCNYIKPRSFFDRTSGDINDITFDHDGTSFAFGCIATNDEYNRPGNLVLQKSARTVKVLDHKSTETNKYPSISCVKFAREGRILLSGGTDGSLKVWSRKGNFLHEKSAKNRVSVNDITTSRLFPQLAVTSHGSGHLDLHTFGSDASASTVTLSFNEMLAPATSCFNDIYRTLIVGYECQDRRFYAGKVVVFDIEKRTEVHSIESEQSYAHLTTTAEGLWITGCNTPHAGTVNIYDPRRQNRAVAEMQSSQTDINEVCMYDNYVVSAATNSTCYVWDVRNPKAGPLHILTHGPSRLPAGSEDITGITNTAFFTSSRFITGGSDGCVKEWDLGRATRDVWVRDFAVLDSPVTRLALSPHKDCLVVGENRGVAHVYSYLGGDVPPEPFMEET